MTPAQRQALSAIGLELGTSFMGAAGPGSSPRAPGPSDDTGIEYAEDYIDKYKELLRAAAKAEKSGNSMRDFYDYVNWTVTCKNAESLREVAGGL